MVGQREACREAGGHGGPPRRCGRGASGSAPGGGRPGLLGGQQALAVETLQVGLDAGGFVGVDGQAQHPAVIQVDDVGEDREGPVIIPDFIPPRGMIDAA